MALTKKNNFTFNHADQINDPNWSSEQTKANFDKRAEEMRVAHNELIDEMASTAVGASGASNIGMEAISGWAGSTVQAVLEAAKVDVDAHKADYANPHNVDKTQVGLSNVDNVQQAAKADFDAHKADLVTDGVHGMGRIASQDYEEGTWTPELRFGGASADVTGAFQGRYRKIGKLVHWQLRIDLSNKGTTTGLATITGLPFASNSSQPYSSVTIGLHDNITRPTSGIDLFLRHLQNSSTLELRSNRDGTTGIAVTDTCFANNSVVVAEGTYHIN